MKKLLTALEIKPPKMKAVNNVSRGLQSDKYGKIEIHQQKLAQNYLLKTIIFL